MDNVVSSLDVAIEALNLAEKISSITPAKAAFGSVGALLTMIRVRFCYNEMKFQVDGLLGFGGERAGVCRAWPILRRHL